MTKPYLTKTKNEEIIKWNTTSNISKLEYLSLSLEDQTITQILKMKMDSMKDDLRWKNEIRKVIWGKLEENSEISSVVLLSPACLSFNLRKYIAFIAFN
jgi:hypothetical protein